MRAAAKLKGALALVIAVAGVTAAAPPAATAALLSTGEAVPRTCEGRLLPSGTAGVATTSWRAPASGLLTVELAGGPEGDWDLAAFSAPGAAPVGASTSFGSDESVSLWVREGDRLELQACRRIGGREAVTLRLDLFETPARDPSRERISLESVRISGPADVARLERLGFDVTHDVSATTAKLVVYSRRERLRLAAAGFEPITLVRDLVADDAADRRREALAVAAPGRSELPSGRESYRVYSDYTSEMKRLAERNPTLVRKLVLGSTFEGRSIQGIEIAAGVRREEDGRPVYLNFGLHHAREWPSGELPMEFALDLVEGYREGKPRVTRLLERVRVVIVPVVNVDGFLVSRSFGTTPADDDSNATLPLALLDQAAYKRKNCRPTVPGSAALPCALRTASGVDLNRNYGAYWGGPGSSSDPTAQNYRGTAPYSEPESEAVHRFTARLHPTVFITNHTFTEDGKWLRQPGFNDLIRITPDEPAMRSLGNAMAAATGWTSELGYATLGDITGATEDWNYFSQGTYGYTPEARGTNFHAEYGDMVVEEYLGDERHRGLGVREAFLVAGERAADTDHHGVIRGTAPPGATLRLRKEFETPTFQRGVVVHDVLDTRLKVPESGRYRWHVNPSGRPLFPGELWTMSCRRPGGKAGRTSVAVDRGQSVELTWRGACGPRAARGPDGPRCMGRPATVVGTGGSDRLRGTDARDVILARRGNDVVSGRGGADLVCAGPGADAARGGAGPDRLAGRRGKDELRGGPTPDVLLGGPGADLLVGGGGRDRCRAGRDKGSISGCP